MKGRMRTDRQTAAVMGQSFRDTHQAVEAEAFQRAKQIDDLRQQAEDLQVEIEMAVSTLSTVVTNLSAVITGAVMQLQSVKEGVELVELRTTPEPEHEPPPELPADDEGLRDPTSRASSNGGPLGYPKRPSLAERLDNYTVTGSACHEWNGPRNLDGFGVLLVTLPVGNRRRTVHRLAWKAAHGEIPHGMQVRHTCGNRACINVEHLELVSDNRRQRRPAKGRSDKRY
jgi:hypothetical protein